MILLLGNKGRMGQRYEKILDKLEVDRRCVDIEFEKSWDVKGIKKVIIATPTFSHRKYIEFFNGRGIEILCEKPICKDVETMCKLEQKIRVPFYMVCNWSFVNPCDILWPGSCTIEYENSRTGDDGLAWDCIQLIYLAKNFDLSLNNKAQAFKCAINGYPVSLADIERSYETMIRDWINCPSNLWNLNDAVLATWKVEKYIEEVSSGRTDSSKK
jgi:hypothetical protein